MSSCIITEGRVSAIILSFVDKTFLFTGTVCRSWYENSVSTATHTQESVDTVAKFSEARQSDVDPWLASFYSLQNSADMSIIRKINEHYCYWDQQDIEHAAQLGRIDVLQFMREKGHCADERVLHTAVRYNHLGVVNYLLSTNTPVDKVVIEWGFGPYVIDELKMRSMEVAISEENLAMVMLLCTVDYPFIDDSFRLACDTENVELVEYLVQQGCRPPRGLFHDAVETRDYFTLNFLIDNSLLEEEWDLNGCVSDDDEEDMMLFLLHKGIIPTDDDVDSAISDGSLATAKFLTSEYRCRPTSEAYIAVFENGFCDCHYLEILNWLYDDMQCSPGFVFLAEMREHPRARFILERCSSSIVEWFKERLY